MKLITVAVLTTEKVFSSSMNSFIDNPVDRTKGPSVMCTTPSPIYAIYFIFI